MRLIDADALLKEYDLENATKYGNKDAKQQRHSYDTMMMYEIADMIKDAPTAYDVDKVVEQLEKCKRIMESPVRKDCYNEECRVGDCTVCAFEKAVEIVKAGGVNE